MLNTLKNLALALLNATLILVALCLFLAYKVSQSANEVVASFAESLVTVEPLKEEVAATRAEIVGLRADLAELRAQPGIAGTDTAARIDARMTAIQTRLDGMRDRMQALAQTPYDLADHAIEKAGAELSTRAMEIRGCGTPTS